MREEQIFHEVLLQPADRRSAFLDNACAGEALLRERVEQLLRAHDNPGSFLQAPKAAAVATLAHTPVAVSVGSVIGPYKLREQIGEGGMGVVYVAEQTEPVQRKVALKVIKPGMASRDVIARFEAERQALAMMDHPNIAKVFDAGTTGEAGGRDTGDRGQKQRGDEVASKSSPYPVPRPLSPTSGQPYFVMELVYGIPINVYCDQHELSTQERLQLFVKVCRAVQHAHQKGIIHRDLKPSNVLVASIDGQAVPKVIDFGVAKAAGPKLTEQTIYTQFSQMVGTPLYMSPEQAELGVADVDTRSDVYALGVMVYELLTGSTPFDGETLKQAGFDEMRRIIREDEPPKPSAMVSTLKAEALSTVSKRRGSDPRRLRESLVGELDWLVMKALEKDRDRRYESASDLAADVVRYLEDEPIEAGPPSVAYRVKKYAQRNKVRLIATTLAAAVLLIGGGVAINAQVQQAREQRAIEQDIEQSLAEARTAIEIGNLAVAQQRVDEAEGRIAATREQLHDLAGRVDALNEMVSQRREQLERLKRFEHLAHEAMDHKSNCHGPDIKDQLREALNTYGVLEDDRWWEKLQQSELSKEQQRRVRSTAYEVLLLLAERIGDAAEDAKELSPVDECLELLEKATKFHDPTRVFYLLRSNFHKKRGNSEQADLDRQQFEATAASTAFDHYLSGQIAAFAGNDEEAIRSYEAALRLEPDHFNSLFFLAYRINDNERRADLY